MVLPLNPPRRSGVYFFLVIHTKTMERAVAKCDTLYMESVAMLSQLVPHPESKSVYGNDNKAVVDGLRRVIMKCNHDIPAKSPLCVIKPHA